MLTPTAHTSGQVQHRFTVSPPFDGASPDAVKVGGGQLAMEFYKPIEGKDSDYRVYRIVNATTGAVIADYEGLTGRNLTLACFIPPEFTLVGPTDEGETIVHARTN